MHKIITALISLCHQLTAIMNKHQRKMGVWLIGAIFIGACLELIGVSIILPFISALIEPRRLLENKYIGFVLDKIGLCEDTEIVVFIGIIIILFYLFKNMALFLINYWQISFRCKLRMELSTSMLNFYMSRPYLFFVNHNSAQILRGIDNDTFGACAVLENVMKFSAEFLAVMLIGIYLLISDWMMAVGVLLLAAICFLLITLGFKKKLVKLGENQRDAYARRNQYAYQAITGCKEIKVTHREKYFVKKYFSAAKNATETEINYGAIGIIPERIIEAICISGLIGVVCIRMSLGVDMYDFVPKLGAFAVAAFRILPSVSRMTGDINAVMFYRPALQATYNNVNKIVHDKYQEPRECTEKKVWDGLFKHEIALENIDWKYSADSAQVLHELSMKIHKGDAIAFVGASGAGKTTLADIILGILIPQKGRVLVDRIDIYSVYEMWCKAIGYVPQTVFLIDDTIKNNIAFGIEEEEIDENLVWEALKKAQLEEYVRSLPNQINTIVGEGGIKFSGGQRQRIAIARALYYDPEILVLDEATAALDADTEAAVMEAINTFRRKKTLIIVAHRLSTIKNCDKIFRISDGKAQECKYEELL